MPSLIVASSVLAKDKIALGQLATLALSCASCSNSVHVFRTPDLGNRFMLEHYATAQAGSANIIYIHTIDYY